MNAILPAIGAGASAGAIMLFLSHVAPRFGAGNFIRDLDQPILFGKTVTRREAHFVGMLTHIALSALFGGLFAFLIQLDWVSSFDFVPILAWGLILVLVNGGVILPLGGHGLFGLKEDTWFPIDLVLTNILWSVLFWWLMHLWFAFVG